MYWLQRNRGGDTTGYGSVLVMIGASERPLGWAERTGGATLYAGDVRLDGTLEAAILRSPHPHARIQSIDVSAALRAEGVVAIMTEQDIPNHRYHHLGPPFSDRTVLACDVVRFIGEEVAVVAADTIEHARFACQLIKVDYVLLPAVTNVADSLKLGSPQLHLHAAGNVASMVHREYGDMASARALGTERVQGEFNYGRAAHASMEPHTVVASWDATTDQLDLWVSSQAPYFVRSEVAHALNLDLEQVHTHEVAVGGSFGVKAKVCEHETLAAALSMRSGRPVRLVLSRAEEFAATKTRHPYHIEMETGATRDGHITHRQVRIIADNGAYNHNGPSVLGYSAILAGSLYRIDGAEIDATLVYTNSEPGGSFRGYGNPQITFAMESQVDELAEALSIDPIDLRIANANRVGDTTLTGWRLESANLVKCLEAVRTAIDWDSKRALKGSGGGVGDAVAIHVSGANAYQFSEESAASVGLSEKSRLTVRFAGSDAGTGQRTVLAQIAAAELDVPVSSVDVEMMTSKGVPRDLGAWSSRGTFMGGHAVIEASRVLAGRLQTLAATKFGTSPDMVTLSKGFAIARGEAMPIGDLVSIADDAVDGELRCEGHYRTTAEKMDRATGTGNFSETYSFVAQAVEVQVDCETGVIEVLGLVTAHDCGVAINPTAAESQAIGAAVMGLGAALGEELVYEGGRLINARYLDYALPRAEDVPPIHVILVPGWDPVGPHGAKGIGEIGLVPTPAAVANAVAHATGARMRSIPFTPDKVLAALQVANGAKPGPNPRPLWRRPNRWWIAIMRAAYGRGLHLILHRWGTKFARPNSPVRVESLLEPNSMGEAMQMLRANRDSIAIAGGTDVVPAIQDGIVRAGTLVSIRDLAQLRSIEEDADGGFRIGASTTLAELSAAFMDSGLAVLAETVESIASPQIRVSATVAGNLCQEKRCWFFRNGFNCYKRGGWTCPCYAVNGDHRFHHAVIDAHRCQAVTPSDLATTLGALGASVVVCGVQRTRMIPISELYTGPGETILRSDELITEIRVPADACTRTNRFEKLSLRSGDFAVATVATSLTLDASRIVSASVVLGGVGPIPFQARLTEQALLGLSLNDESSIRHASAAWVVDAHPLSGNAWKLDATSALVARCIRRSRLDD